MKGTYIGEFQEIVLLVILILQDEAYGVKIQEEIQSQLGRDISRGALHTALTRLEEKNFLKSEVGEASKERGGRRKRLYALTNMGKEALKEAKHHREKLWSRVPEWSLNMNYAI